MTQEAIIAIAVAVHLFLGSVVTGIWVGMGDEPKEGASLVVMTVVYPLVFVAALAAALTRAVRFGRQG